MGVDFEAPADYVEPKRPSPKASPVSASPLQKSPLMESLGAPKLDEDSSDEEEGAKTTSSGREGGQASTIPRYISPYLPISCLPRLVVWAATERAHVGRSVRGSRLLVCGR